LKKKNDGQIGGAGVMSEFGAAACWRPAGSDARKWQTE